MLAGSSVIAARFVSGYLPPFTTTFFSLAFATLTALICSGQKMLDAIKTMSRQRWRLLIMQALFGSFLFRVFLTFGLQYTGATEAGIITGASPAITALLTWLLLRERLTKNAAFGIVLALAGILLVQGFPFAMSSSVFHPAGIILILLAAVCEALFTTLSRKVHVGAQEDAPLSPLVQAGLVSIMAMVFCSLPMLMEQPWPRLYTLPISGWLALLWYGAVVTIVAFACMFAGAKRCSGYIIAAFTGFIPISSTALAFFVLREPLQGVQLIGCGLVVGAAVVISRH